AVQAKQALTVSSYQATKAQLGVDRTQVDGALQNLQMQGMGGFLSVVLQAQSFSDFLSRLQLVQQLIGADLGVITRTQVEAQTLLSLSNQLLVEKTQLATLLAQATAQGVQLSQEQHLVEGQVTALISAQGQQQRVVGADEANQQAVTAAITALESPGTGASVNSMAFIWPVNGPITNPFAYWYDPFAHKWELHTGIDIGVPMYTPIHAAAAGRVIIAGWINGYGNTVVLDNGGGVSTLYAHQSHIEVQVGETVAQGQVIGLVGMTGWATGPHVHFEIRIDGKPVNPVLYLPKR
ncbi:MAG: M23 family metallopeptidase, partial [Sulfobacillus sp.]